MANKIDWDDIAMRRAEFLLTEARSKSPFRDQTVTYALRVISNWATIGKDASSSTIKWSNPRLSQAAWKLYDDLSDEEWIKKTINEHPEPLAQIWAWILKNKDMISAKSILDRVSKWPMITITKQEDDELNKLGMKSTGSPEERHNLIKLGKAGPPKRR